jgi:hypothetical protein
MRTPPARRIQSCWWLAVACLLAAAAVRCGGAGTSGPGPTASSPDRIAHIYARATTQLLFEIDYQQGAEPFTGTFLGMAAFNLFRVNVQKLFPGGSGVPPKTVTLPGDLSQMEQLTDITAASFTGQRILEIASRHRQKQDGTATATFYILFLNGLYDDGKRVRSDVLGVALGQTGVVAMFKPVIRSSSGTQQLQKFVEQTTLVHEFGHSIGLVNFGLPMTAQHQDPQNGAHCSNTRCVMYYANEGASSALQFVRDYVLTGNEVLFDTDCLNDTQARISSAP